jgi:hypothetical protein
MNKNSTVNQNVIIYLMNTNISEFLFLLNDAHYTCNIFIEGVLTFKLKNFQTKKY